MCIIIVRRRGYNEKKGILKRTIIIKGGDIIKKKG